jgi:hypothetical protein
LFERLSEARSKAGAELLARGIFAKAINEFTYLANMPMTKWKREHVRPSDLDLDVAECQLGLGQWRQTLATVERSRKQAVQPDDPARSLYLEGCARWGIKDYGGAAKVWQSAVDQYAGTDYAEKCLAKLHP